ncbi:sugar ABC transporter ATP-binding protein [Bauldia litoralis]|uniref:Monosaccharide ABC transporter ATP-binding protein, CUT2 family (TC 3.A.1.2.-) n=1 Tax=Bauldia litoralis TaxID=665467 RepID=A0A1G6EM53_9HYPH|nr:sugar ABC transporter ATP-binding protein [Bauldia litoralis]SDB58464.1 monosaccharide ABC transporter ATP-binding protein, CUT2 family (TC 3.A.1.2.-) [Bauldia litoralis]
MPEGMASQTMGRPASPGGPLAIDARSVEKRFGGTLALTGVSVCAEVGSINALVGENGAGKSTFLGVIAGRVVPTTGSVSIFGNPLAFGNPRLSRQQGIAAIYQELTIVPALSAVANVFLGQTVSRAGLLSERGMCDRFLELSAQLKVSIPPGIEARHLSVADQQMLEIMRGIQSRARLILFDEPTTALAPPERESLFAIMRELRRGGTTMVIVSHNLDEVLDIADSVTVFRDGEVAHAAPRSEWTKRDLVRAMIGHDLVEPSSRTPFAGKAGAAPLLSATGVSLPGALEGIDIEVRPGEIVGIGGLVGSGRSSLLRALSGFEPKSTGTLAIDGEAVPWPKTPRMAILAGIALVPEDRKTQGLVLGMSAMANITMPNFGGVASLGVISDRRMASSARGVARDFGFDENRVGTTVRNLSGGNQQKVLLGRWRYSLPKVLLVDEPTRGIDVGAKEEILVTLRRLAAQGLGIIVVSSELEEVVQMGDRVLVLSEGRAVARLDAAHAPIKVKDILEAAFKVAKHDHDRDGLSRG